MPSSAILTLKLCSFDLHLSPKPPVFELLHYLHLPVPSYKAIILFYCLILLKLHENSTVARITISEVVITKLFLSDFLSILSLSPHFLWKLVQYFRELLSCAPYHLKFPKIGKKGMEASCVVEEPLIFTVGEGERDKKVTHTYIHT